MQTVNEISDELLVRLSDLDHIAELLEPNVTEYKLEKGRAIGYELFRDDHVHTFRANLKKGTEFPLHEHPSEEIFTVYLGHIEYIYECPDGEMCVKSLRVGDSVTITEGVNHKFIALEESWVISIIIPPDVRIKQRK